MPKSKRPAKNPSGPPAQKVPRVPARLSSLHRWYAKNRRPLPWRKTKDPYRILVSEFLLQQTQVAQAIPYYHRFIKRFPTLRFLALASQHDVLKAWEGAGYYARARNLHKASKIIAENYHGRVPSDYATLLSLPGIGPYMAAAISSIAFGEKKAVLDGNVIRIIARVNAVQQPVDEPKTKKKLQAVAQRWLESRPSIPPSTHNQSMMELGALVCTPRSPDCAHCPLQKDCAAYRRGAQEEFPIKNARPARPLIAVATGLLLHRGKVLIAQRWGDDFLGGLWEFPGGKQEKGEKLPDTVRREFLEEVGLRIQPIRQLMVVRAEYTHKSVDMSVFLCRLVPRASSIPRAIDCQNVRWEKISNLRRYAFPKANHAMIDWLEKQKL